MEGRRVESGHGPRSAVPCAAMMRTGYGLALLLAAGIVSVARAAQYPGWGDTGWVYASRRECCNAAIAIASDYSAQACVTSGGVPRPFQGGGQRGTCQIEWTQAGDGGMLYRCYGEVATWCR
jgi:hypothetical protein